MKAKERQKGREKRTDQWIERLRSVTPSDPDFISPEARSTPAWAWMGCMSQGMILFFFFFFSHDSLKKILLTYHQIMVGSE